MIMKTQPRWGRGRGEERRGDGRGMARRDD
jgi:hypothetical protein